MRLRGLRRPRLTLLAAMAIVALAAILFGWAAAERRQRVAALTVEVKRQQDRVRWAERMQGLGYVSMATLIAERAKLEEVRSRLARLVQPSERP
jgi:hypothetical protein